MTKQQVKKVKKPDWADIAADEILAAGGSYQRQKQRIAINLRNAYGRGATEMRKRAADAAIEKAYSVIDLNERMGPFTLQDKATESCSQNIAAAIRALPITKETTE